MVEYTYVYHTSPESGIYKFKPTGHHKGRQSIRMNRGGLYVAPKFSDAVAWATSYVAHKKGKKHPKSPRSIFYRDITIYKIRVPKQTIADSWGASWWEAEHFIADEHLDSLEIVSKKTYHYHDLIQLYKKEHSKKYDCSRSRWDIATTHARSHNIAAKYYLQLKEELNTLLLAGWKGNVAEVKSLLSNLPDFLWDCRWAVGFDAKPKEKLTTEEVEKVEKIVAKIRKVFENGRKERDESRGNNRRVA
jgi:hypothetical protein